MRGSRNWRRGGGGGGAEGGAEWKSTTAAWEKRKTSSADPEGGGTGGPDPLENHKLYGVLWGISNWTLSLEKVGPPTPGKSWTSSVTLKNESFL